MVRGVDAASVGAQAFISKRVWGWLEHLGRQLRVSLVAAGRSVCWLTAALTSRCLLTLPGL